MHAVGLGEELEHRSPRRARGGLLIALLLLLLAGTLFAEEVLHALRRAPSTAANGSTVLD